MRTLIYNKRSKKFELSPPIIDESNWMSSYLYLIEYSKMLIEAECYSFSKSTNNLLINSQVELQYYVLTSIKNNASWVRLVVQSDKIRGELKQLVDSTLSMLYKSLVALSKSTKPSTPKWRPYTIDPKLKGDRYIKLDNFNRLVYSANDQYNTINILSIMFHHTDDTPNESDPQLGNISSAAKSALVDLFNYCSVKRVRSKSLKEWMNSNL